ncbi:MAG: glutamine--fructose-6-phosphate aminotransferase, partial [Desulfosalsimonas sp.]
YAEDVFHVPPVSEHFAPILNTLVGHMWGYYAALSINEGSRFLHDFREDLKRTIDDFSARGMDIFEIALEKSFREKVLHFYHELRRRQSENRLPATLAIQESTNLVLLLKYLSGRLPIADFEIDFGVKGTAGNMFEILFSSLSEAINAMARPVDAIKHQAKTVTVGTSRIEEKAEGPLFDLLEDLGFSIEHLTINNIMVVRNVQKIIEKINGHTLYRISGVNLLGEPTDETSIEVIDKLGTSASMPSRAETDQRLKGTKKIIVREGNVYLGKGRKDNRSILVIPLISGDPSRPNTVEHLLLLDVGFRKDADLQTRVRALGGKHEHIKNIVQENNITWSDELIDLVDMDELFGRSAEKIAEKIVERVGRQDG